MNILKDVKKKNPLKSYDYKGFDVICIATCGERGIRTPGGVTLNSFQDCRIRPLCHFSLSGCKYRKVFQYTKRNFRVSSLVFYECYIKQKLRSNLGFLCKDLSLRIMSEVSNFISS